MEKIKRDEWIAISKDALPEHDLICLVTDGNDVAMALTDTLTFPGSVYWDPCGCGGIDFEWTFEPTHYIPFNAQLPPPESK